jgi:hypothetical protein
MLAKITIDSVQHFRIVVDGENDWLRHGRRRRGTGALAELTKGGTN